MSSSSRGGGMVDAWVSKTHEGNFVRVRLPLSAQIEVAALAEFQRTYAFDFTLFLKDYFNNQIAVTKITCGVKPTTLWSVEW